MKKLLAALLMGAFAFAPVAGAFANEHEKPAAVEATLQDGTKVEIVGEEVFVVGADGAKTPAPDGDHTLSDGTVVKTMGGKKVQ